VAIVESFPIDRKFTELAGKGIISLPNPDAACWGHSRVTDGLFDYRLKAAGRCGVESALLYNPFFLERIEAVPTPYNDVVKDFDTDDLARFEESSCHGDVVF